MTCHLGDEELQCLQALQDAGAVSSFDTADGIRWKFTRDGLRRLHFAADHAEPQQVFRPRLDLALADRTSFELVHELERQGWVWHLWLPPSKRTARVLRERPCPDGYIVGETKLFFSSALVPPPSSYCLCLLQAETLKEQGLEMLPHGKEEKIYEKILKGDFSAKPPARPTEMVLDIEAEHDELVAGRGSGADSGPVAEVVAVAGGGDMPVEYDPFGGDSEYDVRSDSEHLEYDLEAALEAELDDALIGLDAAELEGAVGAVEGLEPAGAAEAELSLEPPPLPPPPLAPAPCDAPAAVAIVAASREPVDLLTGDSGDAKGLSWGVFRCTARPPASEGVGGQGVFGGWSVRCPYHRKTTATDCKKWFPHAGPTAKDKSDSLWRAMTWCSRYKDYSRQKTHNLFTPLSSECPPLEVLRAFKHEAAPRRASVFTDEELDAGMVPPGGGAAASSGSAAGGGAGGLVGIGAGGASSSSGAMPVPAPVDALPAPGPAIVNSSSSSSSNSSSSSGSSSS